MVAHVVTWLGAVTERPTPRNFWWVGRYEKRFRSPLHWLTVARPPRLRRAERPDRSFQVSGTYLYGPRSTAEQRKEDGKLDDQDNTRRAG